jgi:DNA helicase-2/ATP-dependent DNA helicase PcrA
MGQQLALTSSRPSAEQILEGLDPEQREVALHDSGPAMVCASPGSGKTSSVIARLVYLVLARGVDPSRVLCVTFTKKAAAEMTERAARKLGEGRAQVRTFHALCALILRSDWSEWASWKLDDKDKYARLVKDACGHQHLEWSSADPKKVCAYIAIAKAEAARPGTTKAIDIARREYPRDPTRAHEAYEVAEQLRRDSGLLQFADWMVETMELLERDENVRRKWASAFDYIMCDEVQDNNFVQDRLIELLGRDHRNVMAVGDEKQSIFKFVGARPDIFRAFQATWNARVVRLHRNYRSVGAVIDLANQVLATDGTMTGVRPETGVVRVRSYPTRHDEARAVAEEMRARYEDGARWNDMVVLYRTNALSREIEEALLRRSVPYYVAGGTPFYERAEVKDLLSYVKIVGRRGRPEDARRSLRAPFRYIGKVFLDRVDVEIDAAKPGDTWSDIVARAAAQTGVNKRQQKAAAAWAGLIEKLRANVDEKGRISPSTLLATVVRETKYLEWKRREDGENSIDDDHSLNVRELIGVASAYPTIDEMLAHVDVQVEASEKANDEDALRDRVTLMSCHRSKALEWKYVYVITCNDRVMPHAWATTPEALDEETRIAFVAFTRARDELSISYVRSSTKIVDGHVTTTVLRPSPFIPTSLLPNDEPFQATVMVF